MNELFNSISLRYRQSVVIAPSSGKTSAYEIRGLLLDIAQFGYTLNKDVIEIIRTFDENKFKEFHSILVTNLKEMVGANVKYRPLFKSFPNDIPEDFDYFVKRIVGFVQNIFDVVPEDYVPLSCGHLIDANLFDINEFGACPICQMQIEELEDNEEDKPKLTEVTPLKIIGLVDDEEIYNIFRNLISSNSSISEEDKNVIIALIRSNPEVFMYVPSNIPMKENVALISKLAVDYEYNPDKHVTDYSAVAAKVILDNVKTATDVLRLAAALSDGDISLAEPTRFKLSNKERRVVAWLLNEIKNPEEDMLRYKMRWIKLAEVLHIGKFTKRYPRAFAACDKIRNDARSVETFNSKVGKIINFLTEFEELPNNKLEDKQKELVDLLVERPGEYLRKLDWMLRTFTEKNKEYVLKKLNSIISNTKTTTILSLSQYFKGRNEKSEFRYFMPKGSVAKIQMIDDERNTINENIINRVVSIIENELISRFSKLENLGNIYINPNLKNYLVPLVQRNATKTLKTVARGSRIPFDEDTNTLRMFIYWKQNNSRVDVDLSALIYDDEFKYKGHVSFTNLSVIGGVHSGDIQSAPKGAAEFIDIDIKETLDNGIRYVVMNVISFTGQPFSSFECFAGIMKRNKPGEGKKFEAKTVKNKFDLVGNTKYNIPLIIDLKEREMYWADISLATTRHAYVERTKNKVVKMTKAILKMNKEKPNLFDMLVLHAKGRANTVDYEFDNNKEYDHIFDENFAYKIDEILAEWLK